MNVCLDELRRSQRRREDFLDGVGSDDLDVFHDRQPAPDEFLIQSERAELVRRSILKLSENHRVVVVLRHYEGLKFREIAEALDIPEGTVKTRMTEALTQLGRYLQPELRQRKDNVPAASRNLIEKG